jgi:hypothetical protein
VAESPNGPDEAQTLDVAEYNEMQIKSDKDG